MANDEEIERAKAETEVLRKLLSLQERLNTAHERLPRTPAELREDLRRVLQRAIRGGVLETPAYNIKELLKLDVGSAKARELGGTHAIVGGFKDIPRLVDEIDPKQRIVRDDGAVIHFTITVKAAVDTVLLIAYDFEIYFPSKEPIWFVRFDYNKPDHDNNRNGLRSHLHPSHDDIQLPSAVLSPSEALQFLLYRMRLS